MKLIESLEEIMVFFEKKNRIIMFGDIEIYFPWYKRDSEYKLTICLALGAVISLS